MMKKYYLFLSLSILLCSATAFSQEDVNTLHDNAKAFMLQGDYSNAILILTKAQQMSPQDIEITKDLALNYYLQRDNDKALQTIKPTLDRADADDQCYQIAGNIYQALNMLDDCEKLYKKGIKKFPNNGSLYNDFGELLLFRQDNNDIVQWEKGIQVDPSYSKNYYNACRFYSQTGDKVWTLIYGEIFVNMEPLNSASPEIKDILLETYKKIFSDADIFKNNPSKNKFTQAYLETLSKQSDVTSSGINPETITMIRARFILQWFKDYADKFPFRLFEYQRQLLQGGMFDAYEQWIFGSVQNLAAYQNWTNTHAEEYDAFSRFQRGRIFKIPAGQYYK
jgi:tetratricopeptide (TPR) repeat protein